MHQWFKTHMNFTRNEFNQHYANAKDDIEFYLPAQLNYIKKIDKILPVNERMQNNYLMNDMDLQYQKSIHLYNKLIDKGILPEQACIVLPAALYTEFIETSSLIDYAKIYHLQINHQAQVEIQQYAKAIDKLLIQYFPYS